MVIAPDLTAVVPTYQRQDLLSKTIGALLSGDCVPSQILVSEGSTDPSQRQTTGDLVDSFGENACEIRLLPAPIDGRMCGNRNHLVRSVATPFLLMIDDDCCVHPEFAASGLELLRTAAVDVVTASLPMAFDFRGFWQAAKPGQSSAVSLRCCIGATYRFRETPCDESIGYGAEEADFTFRLGKAEKPAIVVPINLPPIDLAAGLTARYVLHEREQLATSSRILFGIRRYWDESPLLVLFLAAEVAACLLRRQPVPRKYRPDQWRLLARHLLRLQSDCP